MTRPLNNPSVLREWEEVRAYERYISGPHYVDSVPMSRASKAILLVVALFTGLIMGGLMQWL